MDNPDRPPEWACNETRPDSSFDDNCDEPETIERDADLSRAAGATAVGVPLGLWLLMALV